MMLMLMVPAATLLVRLPLNRYGRLPSRSVSDDPTLSEPAFTMVKVWPVRLGVDSMVALILAPAAKVAAPDTLNWV